MENLSLLWSVFYGWMPPLMTALFFAFMIVSIIIIALKLVAFLFDVLPFV